MNAVRSFRGRHTVLACMASLLWAAVAPSGVARTLAQAEPATAAAEDPVPLCLEAYGAAQELRLAGSLLAARERLLVCSQSQCPAPVLKDCSGWVVEVDNSLSSVVFALSDEQGRDVADVHVRTDQRVVSEHNDGRAVLLDPGIYHFTIEAPGYQPVEQTVTVRESEKNRLLRISLSPVTMAVSPSAVADRSAASTAAQPSAPMTPAQPGSGQRGWPVVTTVLLGGAVLGAVSAVFLGLHGQSERSNADRCAGNVTETGCQALIDSGKRAYLAANISWGVAAAAAISAALVYWWLESRPNPPRTHSLQTVRPSAF